jgi:hypothetical protein
LECGREPQGYAEIPYHGGQNSSGSRAKPMIADYILVYKNCKIGVIETKSDEL